jgi:hypothetical protein
MRRIKGLGLELAVGCVILGCVVLLILDLQSCMEIHSRENSAREMRQMTDELIQTRGKEATNGIPIR